MSDSQRSAVYRWENEVRKRWPDLDVVLTLDECKELVKRVWTDYRPEKEPPCVSDGRARRSACGGRWEIKLPKWSRKTICVLHEITHSLYPREPYHGREFATLLVELWSHYAKVPSAEVRRMGIGQKPRRVHFAVAADVPKRPTRPADSRRAGFVGGV